MAMSHTMTTVVHAGVASQHLHILTKGKRIGKQLEIHAQILSFYLITFILPLTTNENINKFKTFLSSSCEREYFSTTEEKPR